MGTSQSEAIEAARALLPTWVGCVNVGLPLLLSFVIPLASIWGAGTTALALAGDPPDESWAERARAVFPVRRAMSAGMVAVSLVLGVISSWFNGPLSPVSGAVLVWIGIVPTSLAAASLVFRRIARRLGDRSQRGHGLANLAVALLIHLPHWTVVAVVLATLAYTADGPAMASLVTGSLAIMFLSMGGGLALLRVLGLARPASSRLAGIVDATAVRVGVRPRATLELRSSVANALAFPIGGWLAFTDRAIELLADDELAAVCAHELGHLAEPWPLRLVRCVQPFLLLAIAAAPIIATRFEASGFALLLAITTLVFTLFKRLRRRGEEHADAVAHAHEGPPGTYARALEKLYQANRVPVVMSGRQTHPDLYDRMTAAAAPPSYVRPLPPRKLPAVAGMLVATVMSSSIGLALVPALPRSVDWTSHDRQNRLWHIALRGGGAHELADLGSLRWDAGDHAQAIVFQRAAAALGGHAVTYAAVLAKLLAVDGQCSEASIVLGEAHQHASRCTLSRDVRRSLRRADRAVSACWNAVGAMTASDQP